MSNLLFLLLAAGVPYYILLEKFTSLRSRHIFLLSAFSLLCAVGLTFVLTNEHRTAFVLVSLVSALYSVYRATKTTNFYKLGYYLIFVNAPFFMMFEGEGVFYSLSLLLALAGIYLIAHFYEKHYGSANYHYITGITLVRPYIATYLSFYLIALSLYPPFPNSLFFLNYILGTETNLLWFAVVITLFFSNFYLAMGVMRHTLFGRPNANIHYVHMTNKEKLPHLLIIALLLVFSVYGLKEILS